MTFRQAQPRPLSAADLFQCKKCGDCCKGYGGTFVTDADILAIAAHLNISVNEFMDRYCQMSGNHPVLAQAENGYCIFWDKLCQIHPIKPRMCKAWPFIKPVLLDVTNWTIMSAACPGIRADIPDQVVKECVKQELSKLDLPNRAQVRSPQATSTEMI